MNAIQPLPPRSFGWSLLAALFATVMAIGIVGFFYLQSVTAAARQVATDNLAAVAESKVREIVNWRAERLSDGNVLLENPFLAEAVARWLANPQTANAEPLLTQFRSWQTHYHYRDVLLADASGQVRLSLGGRRDRVDEKTVPVLTVALTDRRVMLTDLLAGSGDLPPRLNVVVPLAATTEPRCAIILQMDAREFLFPLIQDWPTASPSAETLLIRQEGDDVLFLNELRHRKGTALLLRLPIGAKDLPAARAARGATRVMEGVDYRGVPVLAHVRAVPGTKWFMVAKVDQAEVNAPLRQPTLLISVSVGLLLLVTVLGAGLFWRQQRIRHYREQAETTETLRASELRYRRLFESAKDGILILDAETGMIVDVNPFLIELLGFSREEFLDKKVWELGFFKNIIANQDKFTELQQTEYVRYDDLPLEDSNGQRHPVEFVSNVYRVNSHKVIQCNIRDISERKRAAKALQESAVELQRKNAELERFLYAASHDLKSPVVTVRTFLGYLENDMATGDAGRIAKDMQFIQTATEKMVRLLDDLLEMSRVGRVVGVPVNVTFRTLVDDALATVAGQISKRGVTTQVNDGDVALHGDKARLAEVFQNLIDNACKFMGDQKEPRIEIGVMEKWSDGELGSTQHSNPPALQSSSPPVLQSSSSPVFFVRDNGIGIDPRYQTKLFNLFEKLDPQVEGTGIGLALVKRIVELYAGRIWVESKGVGQGACFYFTLPGAEAGGQKTGDRRQEGAGE